MLSVRNVTFSYGKTPVVDNVSLDVVSGEIVCLLGPSGCGKTTILRLIAGLEQLSQGEMYINGTSLQKIPVHKRGFGLMFQDFALFPHMSVGDNIAYGLKMQGVSRQVTLGRVNKYLELVGLSGYNNRDVAQLSGGEQQRVALARCLIAEPKLLMLDEPLGSLDARLRSHLMVELREIIKQVGVTAIYVTHDQSEAFAVSDQIVVMNKGQFEQIENPRNIYMNPKTTFVASFLGFNNIIPVIHKAEIYVDTAIGRFSIERFLPLADYLLLHPDGLVLNDLDKTYQLNGKISKVIFLGVKYQLEIMVDEEFSITISVFAFRNEIPKVGNDVVIGFDDDAIVQLGN